MDLETEEESSYQIVGEEESDLNENKISFSSPIARALIGKKAGDEVTINIPKGKVNVEVLEVTFV